MYQTGGQEGYYEKYVAVSSMICITSCRSSLPTINSANAKAYWTKAADGTMPCPFRPDCKARIPWDESKVAQHCAVHHGFDIFRLDCNFTFRCPCLSREGRTCDVEVSVSYWPAHIKKVQQHMDSYRVACEVDGCNAVLANNSSLARHVRKMHPRI